MDIKIKIVAAIAPFAIAATVGSTMAYPAYTDYTTKQATVEEKKHEEEELQGKLAGKSKLLSEKKLMEESLEKLRSSIPKKPELELLNIDMEKMCREAGMDMVTFKEADKEQLKAAGMEEDPSSQLTSAQLLKNKIKGQAKTATAASVNGGQGSTATGAAAASATPDTGLSHVTIAVKCIGDYASLMDLVRKMETYQRVIGIAELKTSIPKKANIDKNKKAELPDENGFSETEDQGDFRRLNVQFLLTAYYLP
jgi:Tfp pilus assembly protein PilO